MAPALPICALALLAIATAAAAQDVAGGVWKQVLNGHRFGLQCCSHHLDCVLLKEDLDEFAMAGPDKDDERAARERERRRVRQEERRAEMKSRHDEIRRKYGLFKEENPYAKFEN
ncbi:hypothetical protein WISP_43186 [Willisornis vidua]|uniref:Uncharacterized protein n=1 Tax=Willisornis vidua TaxID=1566151 RepID=A0ABQ9DJ26_9PASS|nr:hypothetical protein WISP_43186 [Willisornis vidua]